MSYTPKTLGYMLVLHRRNGEEAREPLGVGSPLETTEKSISYVGGVVPVTFKDIRVLPSIEVAMRTAERIHASSLNPAHFAHYSPDTDHYGIEVREVGERGDTIIIGPPSRGISHAHGRFSLNGDGSIKIDDKVRQRLFEHKLHMLVSPFRQH